MRKEYKNSIILMFVGLLFWIIPYLFIFNGCSYGNYICSIFVTFLWMFITIPISIIFVFFGLRKLYKTQPITSLRTIIYGLIGLASTILLMFPFWATNF